MEVLVPQSPSERVPLTHRFVEGGEISLSSSRKNTIRLRKSLQRSLHDSDSCLYCIENVSQARVGHTCLK